MDDVMADYTEIYQSEEQKRAPEEYHAQLNNIIQLQMQMMDRKEKENGYRTCQINPKGRKTRNARKI